MDSSSIDDFDEIEIKQLFDRSYNRANRPDGMQRQLLAMMATEPFYKNLNKIKVATLIIHGDYDPVFSVEHAEDINSKITNSRLEIIKDLGHGLPKRFIAKIAELIANHCLKKFEV